MMYELKIRKNSQNYEQKWGKSGTWEFGRIVFFPIFLPRTSLERDTPIYEKLKKIYPFKIL
jgi:2'-5' RNA ligase